MRGLLLFGGLAMIGLGVTSLIVIADRAAGLSFFKGAITLGGSWLICLLYTRQSHLHGVIGGGVVALLAACRSWLNAPRWLEWVSRKCPMPATPLLECFTALLASVIVFVCVRVLLAEKTRRLLSGEQ